MDTGCKVGVISPEKQIASKQEREKGKGIKLLTTILFPHKLFQEYLAGMYLASLYDSSPNEFNRIFNGIVLPRADEFRYVLYFTVSRSTAVGIDIVTKCTAQNEIDKDLVVNITFESQNKEAANIADKHFQSTGKPQCLTIEKNEPSTHTVFGYFFTRKNLVRSTLPSF